MLNKCRVVVYSSFSSRYTTSKADSLIMDPSELDDKSPALKNKPLLSPHDDFPDGFPFLEKADGFVHLAERKYMSDMLGLQLQCLQPGKHVVHPVGLLVEIDQVKSHQRFIL